MRFVHGVEWDYPEPDKVGGRVFVTAEPYGGHIDVKPTYKGAKAEVTFFTTASEDEVVLEGSLHDIRESLQEALEMLNSMDEMYREDFEEHAANAVQCTVCKTWYDQRSAPIIEHPDGCGNTCFGDGTVFVSASDAEVKTPSGAWCPLTCENFDTIHKGDVFRFTSEIRGAEQYIERTARGNAYKRFRRNRVPPVAELGVLVDYVSREAMDAARASHLARAAIAQG